MVGDDQATSRTMGICAPAFTHWTIFDSWMKPACSTRSWILHQVFSSLSVSAFTLYLCPSSLPFLHRCLLSLSPSSFLVAQSRVRPSSLFLSLPSAPYLTAALACFFLSASIPLSILFAMSRPANLPRCSLPLGLDRRRSDHAVGEQSVPPAYR
eukprot:1514823-Rhodomonas_salina.1